MDTSTVIAAILPAITCVISVIAFLVTGLNKVKEIVGNTKTKDEKIMNCLQAQNQKIDGVIDTLEETIKKLEEERNNLALELNQTNEELAASKETNKLLKDEVETLNSIKNQQTVIMDRLRKGE